LVYQGIIVSGGIPGFMFSFLLIAFLAVIPLLQKGWKQKIKI